MLTIVSAIATVGLGVVGAGLLSAKQEHWIQTFTGWTCLILGVIGIPITILAADAGL